MSGGRRTSLASLSGAKVEAVPGQSDAIMVRLPLTKVVPTPLNPRTDFGTPDELVQLGESMQKRQLQPVVVVGRVSYLRLFPEHADDVGTASHVIITGERRYRGARQVGLDSIAAVILEEVAQSRADIVDAVLTENIDRKNFDPIEEAAAVQTMVKECGTAVAAAQRFRRTGGWVSQRLALLRLAPEVQILVRSGELPVRDARGLAGLPAHDQLPAWRARVQERQERTEPREVKQAPPAPARQQGSGSQAAAGTGTPSSPPPAAQNRQTPPAAFPEQSAPTRDSVRPAAGQAGDAIFPGEPEWAAGDTSEVVTLARSLIGRFSRDERRRLVSYLLSVDEEEKATAGQV